MRKPWARIEIGYMTHPKFLALNSNAICLWHEAKNWCDSHQTDGIIPREALKTFRFSSATAIKSLVTSCGQRKPDGSLYAPLWEKHELGYAMHDYLDYNDCREVVLARMDDAEEKRQLGRERLREWRKNKKAKRADVKRGEPPHETPCETPSETVDETRFSTRFGNANETLSTDTETEVPPNPPRGLSVDEEPFTAPPDDWKPLTADEALSVKAGDFLGRFPAVYAKARNGAFYTLKPARDFRYALDLVRTWPDVDYLCDMLELFLRKPDFQPKNVPGTPGQFLHMAPECDRLLQRHGHKRRRA